VLGPPVLTHVRHEGANLAVLHKHHFGGDVLGYRPWLG
jgi:hypothetical protein